MSEALHNTTRPDSATHRAPIVELLLLAGPTVAQMASYTSCSSSTRGCFRTSAMDAPTAAGNAGIFAFAVISFGMGMLFIVNTLVSQAFGAGELFALRAVSVAGRLVSIAFAVAGCARHAVRRSHASPPLGMSPSLAGMETDYLQIVLWRDGVQADRHRLRAVPARGQPAEPRADLRGVRGVRQCVGSMGDDLRAFRRCPMRRRRRRLGAEHRRRGRDGRRWSASCFRR